MDQETFSKESAILHDATPGQAGVPPGLQSPARGRVEIKVTISIDRKRLAARQAFSLISETAH